MSGPENRDKSGRFGPGNCANPGGRPKLLGEFQDWLREQAYPRAQAALLECLHSENEKIKIQAVREVNDRLFGKAPQAITGADGGAIQLDGEIRNRVTKYLLGEGDDAK